ncbi:MAG: tRNA (adenosine(37)-N6)-threonylcarbamoyltransferase complex transferase subunit TsaD [Rhodospirillales bacterium]|nr:tRNA (adenosine(37)-N6)-threonylcarbamoyltransferase complex transferase subunit TsaD [Rhodospirillales bacterium]
MIVLGIETSCDETAVALVDADRQILSNLVLSQIADHAAFGGVVPEIAARAHLDHLDSLIHQSLRETGIDFKALSGIAATSGPGLIGGLIVGMMAGKAIAAARNLPFIAVNHLEAHALTPRLTENIPFPYLLLLVSGGHTQLVIAKAVGNYDLLGATRDDAAGECFDKAAKLMGIPFPGGPNLEKAAQCCLDPEQALSRFPLPRPMEGRPGCDFSFSGLKTALRTHTESLRRETDICQKAVADLSFALETTIAQTLGGRCAHAMRIFREKHPEAAPLLVAAGGVAANKTIRAALAQAAKEQGFSVKIPPPALCGDNAVMVAWAGLERLRLDLVSPLDTLPQPRWPLETLKSEKQT